GDEVIVGIHGFFGQRMADIVERHGGKAIRVEVEFGEVVQTAQIQQALDEHPDAKMVRTRRWKYIYYPEGFAELYDLKSDPQEMNNLAESGEFREQVYKMKDHLLHWLTTADEPDQIAPRWLRPIR
ncbi:MAG: sulfatase/phosphatase domain-containing protein, partial [Pirellulaceae bacterium]